MKTLKPGETKVVLWEADKPEADLLTVANHDFSGLSSPIIVACRDKEQFEEFIFREGLMCSEIRRVQPSRWSQPQSYPKNKILLLLPDWQDDFATSEFVHRWVNLHDRYTVQLNSPKPLVRKTIPIGTLILLSALIWGIIWIMYLNFRR